MRQTLLTLALCCSFSQLASAQQQEHAPWLNAFGRFWGIGYSAGYHAQTNSRLGLNHYSPTHNVIPEPPRGLHANPNLYAGHAGGQIPYGYPQVGPGHSPTPAPTPSAIAPQNVVPAPPKPVEPPPNWLKQYIKPTGDAEKSRAGESLNDVSPSDRKGVMLAPSPEDSTTGLSITPAFPPEMIPPSQPPMQIGGRPVISVMQQ